MTETTVEIRQVAAYSNLISSKILADHMNTYLEKLGPIPYTEQEYAYAQKFQQSLSDQDKNQLPTIARDYFGPKAPEAMKTPIFEPIACQNLYSDLKYSTDVGDVSWIVPTVHLNIPTFAAGTALHSWQAVAQGKSSIAHKGMLYAAKIMALTAWIFTKSRTGKSSQKRTDRNSKRRNISQSITERPETRDMVKVTFCQFPARSHLSPGVNLTSLSNS